MNPESGSEQQDTDFVAPETGTEEEGSAESLLWEAYGDSKVLEQKDIQASREEPFRAAFTDIDNTFFRNDRAAEANELAKTAESYSYPLIAVTGNDYKAVQRRIESGELPAFEMIIGSVGTEVWVKQQNSNEYKKDEYFQNTLEQSNYRRPDIAKGANDFFNNINQDFPGFALEYQQPDNELAYLQGNSSAEVQPFKLSFCFFAENDDQLSKFSELASNRFPDQELVVCEEINYNAKLQPGESRKKYNLDILPITKAGAVEYAAGLLGVEQGIVAGDSGNDTDMLLKTGKLNAVVVGGAKSELVSTADQEKSGKSFQKITDESGNTKAIYIERDSQRLGPESINRAASILMRAERMFGNDKSNS